MRRWPITPMGRQTSRAAWLRHEECRVGQGPAARRAGVPAGSAVEAVAPDDQFKPIFTPGEPDPFSKVVLPQFLMLLTGDGVLASVFVSLSVLSITNLLGIFLLVLGLPPHMMGAHMFVQCRRHCYFGGI